MSQNYGPFPAVCGQPPASVLITGLGPKCIRCVLEENEPTKYFNGRNMLLLDMGKKKSSKDRNFLVLLKVKYVNMGTSLEILVRLMTKLGKKKSNAAQINVLKKSRSVFVLWSGDSRKDLCKWAVVVVRCFLLYIYM